MNEEISDLMDPNYQDYTTATDWEVFIARIEEIIRDFRVPVLPSLPSSEHLFPKLLSWKITTENLHLNNDVNFILSHYVLRPKKEFSSNCNDKDYVSILNDVWENGLRFIGKSDNDCVEAVVGAWYSLREFLVLVPSVEIFSETRIKLYLSSISIALANSKCKVPIFLKIRSDWQHYYVGLLEHDGLRTRFDTVHLGKVPHQCYHLSGILDMFKAKLASPVPIEMLEISSKFSFNVECSLSNWKSKYLLENLLDDQVEISSGGVLLPFGAVEDPLASLILHVIWPKLSEDAVMDTASYTDFDSLSAPLWSMEVNFKKKFDCVLPKLLHSFILLLDEHAILLDELPTESRSNRRSFSFDQSRSGSLDFEFLSPLSEELVQTIVYFLFPDAANVSFHAYDCEQINNTKDQDTLGGFNPMAREFLKVGPEGGLVWRLSLVAVWIYATSGLIALSQLWYEFIEELQYRWDHHKLLPGVSEGTPNAKTCLLHQKLQLLNCCIIRAEDRAGQSSDEEEFFDCDEDGNITASDGKEVSAEGRACRLGDAMTSSGTAIFVPLTQQPAPRTDDDLRADAALLIGLGSSSDAAPLRARIMAASLTSDMQAFKAANPSAIFADFVKWYSPRDWCDGALSERMLLPDNAWIQAWQSARAIPASRQRRLFDERREAERILHFLRTRTIAQAASLLMPTVLRCAMKQIQCNDLQVMRSYVDSESDGSAIWKAVEKELFDREVSKAREDRLKTLTAAFESDYEATETIDPNDVRVGREARNKIWKAVSGSQPMTRQFCIRAQVLRRGRVTPQMFRAILKPSEIKLLAVISDDITFL